MFGRRFSHDYLDTFLIPCREHVDRYSQKKYKIKLICTLHL